MFFAAVLEEDWGFYSSEKYDKYNVPRGDLGSGFFFGIALTAAELDLLLPFSITNKQNHKLGYQNSR